jgi:hypothetical protein
MGWMCTSSVDRHFPRSLSVQESSGWNEAKSAARSGQQSSTRCRWRSRKATLATFASPLSILFGLAALSSSTLPVSAQRERRPDEATPPGLERWLGQDECQAHQRWFDFYESLSKAVELHNTDQLLDPELMQTLLAMKQQEANNPSLSGGASQQIISPVTGGLVQQTNQNAPSYKWLSDVVSGKKSVQIPANVPAVQNLAGKQFQGPGGALGILQKSTEDLVSNPELAFQCGTAMAAAYAMMSGVYDKLGLPIQALRATQSSSIFAA